jgi:hypothetical protein
VAATRKPAGSRASSDAWGRSRRERCMAVTG